MTRISATVLALAAMLGLSSCGSDNPKGFICPATAGLVDAASLTEFAPGSTDSSSVAYRVDMTRVFSDCTLDEDTGAVTMRVQIDFSANRMSPGAAASYTVPFFIGLSLEGTSVVDKKLYSAAFAFEQGQSTTTFTQRIENFTFQPGADKKATDFELLAGFQLTQAQLDYNRRAGRYPR